MILFLFLSPHHIPQGPGGHGVSLLKGFSWQKAGLWEHQERGTFVHSGGEKTWADSKMESLGLFALIPSVNLFEVKECICEVDPAEL